MTSHSHHILSYNMTGDLQPGQSVTIHATYLPQDSGSTHLQMDLFVSNQVNIPLMPSLQMFMLCFDMSCYVILCFAKSCHVKSNCIVAMLINTEKAISIWNKCIEIYRLQLSFKLSRSDRQYMQSSILYVYFIHCYLLDSLHLLSSTWRQCRKLIFVPDEHTRSNHFIFPCNAHPLWYPYPYFILGHLISSPLSTLLISSLLIHLLYLA